MKYKRTSCTIAILTALILFGLSPTVGAEDEKALSLEERIKNLEQLSDELLHHELAEHDLEDQQQKRKAQAAGLRYGGSGGLIYARPGYSNPRAVIGGYMDLEYANLEGPTNARRNPNSSFDQTRFVPFIYSDVTENTRMAAELEVEHGIGEAELEFAVIDHSFAEWINFRAGVILLPVGKFNLVHDSPINDLTQRPEVTLRVIPGVLREPGVGVFGTFYPTQLSKLDYEVYVTQGMNGFSKDGTSRITDASGLAGARWQTTDVGLNLDNNNNQAVTSRLAYSPLLGVEIGASGYHAKIDPESKRPLTIGALDWTFMRGPWEFLGEAAYTTIEDNDKDLDGRYIGLPERMFGWYGQLNYHFMPTLIQQLAPKYFTNDSIFTAVLRVDDVNTNLDVPGLEGDVFRITPGINFRPTEDTAFKFEYQYNFEPNRITGRDVMNDGIILSVATYF